MLYKTFLLENSYYAYDTVTNNIYCISKDINSFLTEKKQYNNLSSDEKKIVSEFYDSNILKSSNYNKLKFDYLDNFENNFKLTEDNIKKLTLVLNQKCNFACTYCLYCDSYKRRKNLDNSSMSFEMAKKSIDYYFTHSTNVKQKNITIYGGEPMLDKKKLQKIIEYARNKFNSDKLKINLTSNGALLNENTIKLFIKNKVFLNISLDGPKDIHNKYRKTRDNKNTFERVMGKIIMIKNINQKYFRKYIAISVTVTPPYDYVLVENFFKDDQILNSLKLDLSYVEEKDANWIKNDIYKEKIKAEKNIIKKCTNDYISGKTISDLYRNIFFMRLNLIKNRSLEKIDDNLSIKGPCFPSVSMLVVNTNGEFNICTMLDDCYNIGNINAGLNKNKIKKSLENIFDYIDSRCKKCWLVRLCHPCLAKFNQGDKLPIRKNICDYRRSIYLEIIKSYIKINNKII